MKFFLLRSTALALIAAPGAEALWRPFSSLRGSDAGTIMAGLGNECTDLGEAAAEHVVKDNWCTPDGSSATSYSSFPSRCKRVAYGVCRGTIPDVTSRWCPRKRLRTSNLRSLMDECEDQVDRMVGGGSSDPCDLDVIFADQPSGKRSTYARSARRGNLKRDYPDVWKDTRYARNRCKKDVGFDDCKDMGYCFAEDEFEDELEEYSHVN